MRQQYVVPSYDRVTLSKSTLGVVFLDQHGRFAPMGALPEDFNSQKSLGTCTCYGILTATHYWNPSAVGDRGILTDVQDCVAELAERSALQLFRREIGDLLVRRVVLYSTSLSFTLLVMSYWRVFVCLVFLLSHTCSMFSKRVALSLFCGIFLFLTSIPAPQENTRYTVHGRWICPQLSAVTQYNYCHWDTLSGGPCTVPFIRGPSPRRNHLGSFGASRTRRQPTTLG